jgi:hypothetical protein
MSGCRRPRKRCSAATGLSVVVPADHLRPLLIRDILWRMRHDGCGGRAGKAELLTGVAFRRTTRA